MILIFKISTMSFLEKTKKFFYPIKYAKLEFFMTVFFSVIFGLITTYSVIFLKNITSEIENENWEKIKFRLIIWFIVITIKFIIDLSYKRFPFRMFSYMQSYMYKDCINKVFEGDNNKIEQIGTGRIISIVQKGIWNWLDILSFFCWDGAQSISVIITIFITISMTNIYVAIIGFIVLVFCFIWIWIFYPKADKWRKKSKAIDTEIDRLIVLHIMNKFEIFQNNKQEEETKKVFDKNKLWLNFRIKEKFWQGLSYNGIEYFIKIILILTAFYFAYQVFIGKSTLADFVLFTGFATLIGNQIGGFMDVSKRFSDNYIHVEKLEEFLEEIQEKNDVDEKNKKEFIFKNGDIEIKNVDFSYGENKVFKKFSLKIKGGTKTAFVGESGGGKSTLVKLLASYIKVDSGKILIDNQDLKEIKINDYYKNIGYLTQDPSVFDGTILENLTYALKKEPTKEELERCIKLSKCEFIYDFKNGLKTEIGERGIRLSGGQKQRLAIAKIMLKNPNIILLDEPTSALDSFNEELINKALQNLFKGKTVIVIAHRLQTVKEADRILLFEKGKIVEDGNHRELIKLKGKYKKMLLLQSGF